jgi:hypothetical protein
MKETMLSVDAPKLLEVFLSLMPTRYQKDNLKALLFLFLQAQGTLLPGHSQTQSPSALSRFLNRNEWSERRLIREQRQLILRQLARQ